MLSLHDQVTTVIKSRIKKKKKNLHSGANMHTFSDNEQTLL